MSMPEDQGSTAGQRRAHDLAHATVARINAVAPPGLAAWTERLPAITAADRALLAALAKLESHAGGIGIGQLEAAATAAADTLVNEWQRAARRWDAKGRPAPATLEAAA